MLPPVNCPTCNSKQRFVLKKRFNAEDIETYVVCLQCQTEIVLSTESRKDHIRHRRHILNRTRRMKEYPPNDRGY